MGNYLSYSHMKLNTYFFPFAQKSGLAAPTFFPMLTQIPTCTLKGTCAHCLCAVIHFIPVLPFSFHSVLKLHYLDGIVNPRVDYLLCALLEVEGDFFYKYNQIRLLGEPNPIAIKEELHHQRGLLIPVPSIKVSHSVRCAIQCTLRTTEEKKQNEQDKYFHVWFSRPCERLAEVIEYNGQNQVATPIPYVQAATCPIPNFIYIYIYIYVYICMYIYMETSVGAYSNVRYLVDVCEREFPLIESPL